MLKLIIFLSCEKIHNFFFIFTADEDKEKRELENKQKLLEEDVELWKRMNEQSQVDIQVNITLFYLNTFLKSLNINIK